MRLILQWYGTSYTNYKATDLEIIFQKSLLYTGIHQLETKESKYLRNYIKSIS